MSPAAEARADARDGDSSSRNKILAIVGGLVLVAAVVIGAIVVLSSGDDDSDDVAATDTDDDGADAGDDSSTTTVTDTSTSVAETTSVPTTSAPPTTTEAPSTSQGGGSGTPNDPFPIENASFTYSEQFSDTTWDGVLYGIVETDRAEFNDTDGRCVVVIGVITPTRIERGFLTNGFDAPAFGAVDENGVAVDSAFADCDTTGVEEAGYSWVRNATVTVGTPYAFYEEIFFENQPDIGIQAIQAGDDPQDSTYYRPTVLAAIPQPDLDLSGSQPPPPGEPMANAQFTYEEEFNNATWDGELLGLVEIPARSFIERPGRCFVILGTLTPTATDEGTVSDGFDTPNLGVVSRGRYIDSQVNSCEVDDVEAAGFGWILDAEVELGTAYPFYAEVFVPRQQDIQAVLLGPTSGENALVYRPEILDAIPTP